MGGVGCGQLAFAGSIQLDGVQVPLGGRGLAGSVVDAAAGFVFVHRVDRRDFPVALGQLRHALAVDGREKDVAEAAIALAGPQEALAVLEKLDVAIEVDPVRVGLLEYGGRRARFRVDRDHLQLVLHTTHAQDIHRARVRHPPGTRDQISVARVADFEPLRGTAGGGDHAQPHVGIVFARLRIAFNLRERARAQHVRVRKHGLAAGVELQVTQRLGIRRPPEAGAQLEFLGVDPIGDPVAQRVRAVARETRLLAGGHVYRIEVPSAPERHHAGVGRELGV